MQGNKIKLCLIGSGKTGKTRFTTQIVEQRDSTYVPTLGVSVRKANLRTTVGDILVDIWDTAGVPKYGGLMDGYYINSDACIVFGDTIRSEYLKHFFKSKTNMTDECMFYMSSDDTNYIDKLEEVLNKVYSTTGIQILSVNGRTV